MLVRLVDFLKEGQITSLFTNLTQGSAPNLEETDVAHPLEVGSNGVGVQVERLAHRCGRQGQRRCGAQRE